jgi:hypothetical protein
MRDAASIVKYIKRVSNVMVYGKVIINICIFL